MRNRKILLILFTIATSVAAVIGIGIVSFRADRDLMRRLVIRTAEQSGLDIEDTQAVRAAVKAIGEPPCSEAFLGKMRAILLKSSGIKDIAYRSADGATVCGALGIDPSVLESFGPPHFISSEGWRLWSAVELDAAPGMQMVVLDTGQFVLARPSSPESPELTQDYRQLSIVRIRNDNSIWPGQGENPGLGAEALRAGEPVVSNNGLATPACAGWICYVLRLSWPDFVRAHEGGFVSAAVIGAVFGGLSTTLIQTLIGRYCSMGPSLRRAIRRQTLVMYYQPVVELGTGKMICAEALMRWFRPDGSMIDTNEFIDTAESEGFITDITLLAIQLVGREMGPLMRSHRAFRISLNITARDLDDPRFRAALRDHIERQGILPSQVGLELTERTIISGRDQIDALIRLRDVGYRVYIDDFGTGYSNLSYLSDIAPDKIKIDRSFIGALDADSSRFRLLAGMVDLVHELGVAIIAEGVEKPEQLASLRERGVQYGQGWLFSRPLSASRIIGLFERIGPDGSLLPSPGQEARPMG